MKRRIFLFVLLLGIASSGFAQFVAATMRSPVDGSQ
jgi:hypothetical protein